MVSEEMQLEDCQSSRPFCRILGELAFHHSYTLDHGDSHDTSGYWCDCILGERG